MTQDRIDVLSRSLADSTSRRSLLKLLGVGVTGTAITAVGLDDTLAKRKGKVKSEDRAGIGPVTSLLDIPVRAHQEGRNFKGTFDVTGFSEANGGIVATGLLTGKVTGRGVGNRAISQVVENIPVNIPALQSGGLQAQQCEILFLELGPITLNVLGLEIYIGGPNNTPLIVEITADPSGGLLGQLLCGLLGAGSLAAIIGFLNDILDLLEQH